MNRLLIALVRLYKLLVSPALTCLGAHCRFHPCCSDYALGVLSKNKTTTSLFLIAKRLAKCGPWHPGGIDEPITLER